MSDDTLEDGVEGIMLELLASDDPVERAGFIAALIHDGFDPDMVKEMSEMALANKKALRDII